MASDTVTTGRPRSGRLNFVLMVYLDDSGSTGKNLADKDQPFQVLGAVILRDSQFASLEKHFAALAGVFLPATAQKEFEEFHAQDMLSGAGKFQGLSADDALRILSAALAVVCEDDIPVMYGAVDKKRLAKQFYKSADPVDMAFTSCMKGVERWFTDKAPDEFGVLIADDGRSKNMLHNSYRELRRRVLLPEIRELLRSCL